MSLTTKALLGCLILPVALIASYFAKSHHDEAMQNLPGEVLKSSAPPTQKLETAMQVAGQLDAYVQPRFESMKDNVFGISRLIHRNHAEIVELKNGYRS